MRPLHILVDMDGVLADFDSMFYERRVRQGLFAIPPWQLKTFYADQSYPPGMITREMAIEEMQRGYFFRDMSQIPGAYHATQRLLRMGHTLQICSKPLKEVSDCVEQKTDWLYDRRMCWNWKTEPIFTQIKAEHHADYLIDDRPNALEHDREHGFVGDAPWKQVLFVTAANQEAAKDHDGPMMYGWSDLRWLEEVNGD